MGKIWQLMVAAVLGLGLSMAIVGCGSSTAPTKDKMGGDKMMSGDKMKDDKMGGDKMKGDKMKDGGK